MTVHALDIAPGMPLPNPRLLTYVEIDVDRCANIYKVLPCMAFQLGDINPRIFGQYFGNSNLNNWTAGANTAVHAGTDGMIIDETGANPIIQSAAALNVAATDDFFIEFQWVRLAAASSFVGKVYYNTAGHTTFSDSFRATFSDAPIGVVTTTRLDMSDLASGGTDFVDAGAINQIGIRWDGAAAGTNAIKLIYVKWGKVADATDAFDHKCFNSLRSCQFRPQLTPQIETLRFAMPTDYLPLDIDAVPNVTGLSFSPGTISLGQDLGQRATMTVSFIDHPHPDTGPGGDRYVSERPYNPYKQGTYWGKFRARYPYLQGRPMRIIRGNLGQDLADMDIRYYIIDSFDGPKPDGSFSIIAKDVLKLADDDKSQAPTASEGFLSADITSTATSATLQPTGVGALYPASGFLNIGGSEIVSYTRSGDVFTISRAKLGTVAAAHNSQDRAQLCLQYSAQTPSDIIYDLLTTYADIPADFIVKDDWDQEVSTFLGQSYTATIADPVGVNTLISELIEQAALALWWDDATQTIKLQVLRTITSSAETIDENLAEGGQVQAQEQPDLRLSQVWTYYALINPLVDITETSNYRSVELLVSGQLQSDYGSPAIKQIFSRWIPQFGRAVATRLNQLVIGQYQDPPRKFNFQLFGPTADVTLGSGYNLMFRTLQDEQGRRATVPIQITRLNPDPSHYQIEAQEALFTNLSQDDLNTHTIVIDTNTSNFNLRTIYDTLFAAPTSSTIVRCVIQSGVTVNCTTQRSAGLTTRMPAFNVGSWPAGVDITIFLGGDILGGGGHGGNAAPTPQDGQVGGTGLLTTVPIKITVLSAGRSIRGGGGGGAALFTSQNIGGTVNRWAAGGGGAQGNLPGLGGTATGASGSQGVNRAGTAGTTSGVGSGASASVSSDHAGNGGNYGNAGAAAVHGSNQFTVYSVSSPGAAGRSIDGISHVTFTDLTPTLSGPQVN